MAERKCWTVATGRTDIFRKASRDAAKYMAEQRGFVGVHIVPDGTGRQLFLYDSENHAKIARNMAESKGIVCGNNICECYVDERYLAKEDEE